MKAADDAFEEFIEYITFDKNFPVSGGLENQLWDWVEGYECVKQAHGKAMRECEAEYEEYQERIRKAEAKRKNNTRG